MTPYAVALALVIGVIALFATIGNSTAGRILTSAVLAAALLIPFSEAKGGLRARIPLIAAVVSVTGVLIAEFLLNENAVTVYSAVGLAVSSAALVITFQRIIRREPITADKVFAALTAYLFLGYGFSMAFGLFDAINDGSFFTEETEPKPSDFIYFSLITLTTVGYGDLTAGSKETRLLAAMEAVTGQLFLVSVVAILVGRLVAAKPLEQGTPQGLFDDPLPSAPSRPTVGSQSPAACGTAPNEE
jgi:hypothetical protein